MRLIMLGPPGAGKGTQAKGVANQFNIPQISTGDIFRNAIKNETPLGSKVKSYMNQGLLVPDETVLEIVAERLKEPDCREGFVLDGFPRTIPQAKILGQFLEELGWHLDAVVNIDVSEQEIIERFTGRRVCEACGATYHIKYNAPKQNGICDICGGKLIVRDDDEINTVKNRLQAYKDATSPLIDYYSKKDILIKVDGGGPIEEVFQGIMNRLESKRK